MQGLYYSLRLHHRDTEAQRNAILFLKIVIPSAARNQTYTAACRKRCLTGLGTTNLEALAKEFLCVSVPLW
jgi:hypothetical protein